MDSILLHHTLCEICEAPDPTRAHPVWVVHTVLHRTSLPTGVNPPCSRNGQLPRLDRALEHQESQARVLDPGGRPTGVMTGER